MKQKHNAIQETKPTAGGKYLRTAGAAAYCNRSESAFEKARHFGKGGPPFYRVNRTIYYKISDLDEWIESRKYLSTSEYGREGGDVPPKK